MWVKQRQSNSHTCEFPERYITVAPLLDAPYPDGHLGDLWRCDECSRLWRVGLACNYCDYYGPGSGICGSHRVGLKWRYATFLQRLVYRKR